MVQAVVKGARSASAMTNRSKSTPCPSRTSPGAQPRSRSGAWLSRWAAHRLADIRNRFRGRHMEVLAPFLFLWSHATWRAFCSATTGCNSPTWRLPPLPHTKASCSTAAPSSSKPWSTWLGNGFWAALRPGGSDRRHRSREKGVAYNFSVPRNGEIIRYRYWMERRHRPKGSVGTRQFDPRQGEPENYTLLDANRAEPRAWTGVDAKSPHAIALTRPPGGEPTPERTRICTPLTRSSAKERAP